MLLHDFCVLMHIGFCDASSKAYATIVYLRLEAEDHQVDISFIAA